MFFTDKGICFEEVLYVDDLALLPKHQGKLNGFFAFKKILQLADANGVPVIFHAKDDSSWELIKGREKVFERYDYKFEVIEHDKGYYDNGQGAHLVRVENIQTASQMIEMVLD